MMGYDTILLDRALNRDMDGLREIKKLTNEYPGITTSLLVTEGCMPQCPFKVEHDGMQAMPQNDYWSMHGQLTCSVWRVGAKDLPRVGTDIVWGNNKTFDEYAELVDIFKFSGRLGALEFNEDKSAEDYKFIWANLTNIDGRRFAFDPTDLSEFGTSFYGAADCFADVYDNELGPLSAWQGMRLASKDFPSEETWDTFQDNSIWSTKKGKSLNVVLKTCRNQCWDCHACERTFGVDDYDSLIEVNRDMSRLRSTAVEVKIE
jgi:hypothetical protein